MNININKKNIATNPPAKTGKPEQAKILEGKALSDIPNVNSLLTKKK